VAAAGCVFTGCNDAEYGLIDNSVYISEAASAAKSVVVSLEQTGADVIVNVRLAKHTDADVRVGITFDPALLAQYNADNATNYLLVPVDSTDMPANAHCVIPAGEIGAAFNIHVKYFDPEGKKYALPVVLGNVEGGVSKSAVQDRLIYALSVPLFQPVPVIKTTNGDLHANPTGAGAAPWGLQITQWSYECWMLCDGYTANNQVFFTNELEGAHEIYARFGDAGLGFSFCNYLQIKTLGNANITDPNLRTRGNGDLVANTWYHWAIVYDGALYCTIYRNGEVYAKGEGALPTEGYIKIDKACFGYGGGANNRQWSQARFWKKALTPAEIKDNMYQNLDIEKHRDNLIAYWPMNEGSGNVLTDVTGNGHDIVITTGSLEWLPSVRFGN
jgi:hypothetical protein